jgi:type IV pilus assembly protein PilQ
MVLAAGTEETSPDKYTVQPGDTLWTISQEFGLSVEDLKFINKLSSNKIVAGEILKLTRDAYLPSKRYRVQPGDTLWDISQAHGVSVEDLKLINNLESNKICYGQVISLDRNKIPTPSRSAPGSAASGVFSIDTKSPELDLSLYAATTTSSSASTGYGEGQISMDVRDADLRDVLSALAFKLGATIILGRSDGQVIKVTFKVQGVSANQALDLLVQSQGLAYIQRGSLIVVDSSENLKENFFNQMLLTQFNTYYVTAATLKGMMDTLEIPLQSITLDTNPNVMWVQGTAQSLQKVRELVLLVDRAENLVSPMPLEYKTIVTTQISTTRVLELLGKMGVEVKQYIELNNRLMVFDREIFPMWGDVEKLIAELDTQTAKKETAFIYQLKNIVAADAEQRLALFDFGSGADAENTTIKTVTFNNPIFSREILIISPVHLENEVRSALGSLDMTRDKIRVPVLKTSGKGAHASCSAKRELLSTLSGVSAGSMHVSSNLSGDSENPEHVLWVEATPDQIQLIRNLLNAEVSSAF